jgi:hypothetical protein
MDLQEFLRRHLPPGARCGHDVLFDWHGEVDPTPPTAERLEGCVRDLAPILRGAQFAVELYTEFHTSVDGSGEFHGSGHDASELTLGLLYRGAGKGVALPRGESVEALMVEIRRLLAAPDFYGAHDAVKRLRCIAEVLAPDADAGSG